MRKALVLGGLDGWSDALRRAGVEVGGEAPELVVAPAGLARTAVRAGADQIVLEGRGGARTLDSAGFAVRRLLPLPSLQRPELLLPLHDPAASTYALERWAVPTRRWKRARNSLLRALLARRALPPVRPLVTVGSRGSAGPPFLVAAAEALGVPPGASWFLTLGRGDALARGVFQLFPPGSPVPAWVLKFARVPGYEHPFEGDQRGLELARAAGGEVAERAPRFVGRLAEQGYHASLETAAVGTRLLGLLSSPGDRQPKVRLIEAVAGWLVELARRTAASPELLEPERRRLSERVVPEWARLGASPDLAAKLPPVRPVLQHGNLGSWNVVVDGGRFVAVDWEKARAHGLPVWDLVYFLSDALAQLDGAQASPGRERHFVQLFRGELQSSALLFAWTRSVVEASGVPREAVGPLVTLCWLDDGLPNSVRAAAAERYEPGSRPERPLARRLAELWLSTPSLGAGWDRWGKS